MIKLYCEWDIGHETVVFEDHEVATEWARPALKSCGVAESFEECLAEGLIGFEEVTYIRKNQ